MFRSDDDVYGVNKRELEVDSDSNEDPNRENLLDDSFEAWYDNIKETAGRKLELTNVPKENVFDAAVRLDEDQS
ncbi:hypothetical protein [Paenibacillus sp.]|uniref:hypothetical protein n=1 Tax=Paenibacillus sp. TaxID=58172 RepID=UPI00281131F9|nr:hypothetical protein [Paenibacillus sp.]